MASPIANKPKTTSVKKAPGRATTTDGRPGGGASASLLSFSPLCSRWADTRTRYHGTGAGADGITTFARG